MMESCDNGNRPTELTWIGTWFHIGNARTDGPDQQDDLQCSTYLVPPRDRDPTFKGGQTFHILAYMPHDQQAWKSRIDWMKSSPEGGFTSRKWIYGRGSIVGVLNPALLEEASR